MPFAVLPAFAQVPVDDDGTPIESLGNASDQDFSDAAYESEAAPLTATELETLVGPIALYPDDLLAIVLPASTYPLQIVQAARFLEAYSNDSTLEPDESWDESVVALINYPEVIDLLNEDIDWTWRLGEAVISQQEDIVAAVESFRERAYVAGNLKSDEYQTVTRDDDIIEVVPIEDDVIYVPYYEPELVVVHQPRPVYHYYARPYPVYYYPYPTGHAFSSGYFWGVTTAFRIGWATDHLRVHHASYWGHPYYGHHYYGHYYRRPSISVYNTVYVNNARRYSTERYRDGDYWRPRRSAGARQSDYYAHTRHYRSDTQRVRNSTNRSSDSRRNRNDSATTVRTNYTTSDSTADLSRRARTTATTNSDRRQRATTTSNNDRRQRTTSTANETRRQRPASVERAENRGNDSGSRRRNARPETPPSTRQVAHNADSKGNRRQSEQRTQRQPQSKPARTQKRESSHKERSSGERSEKTERKSERGRSEGTSRRKARSTN